ncbi:nicotinamide riboside kinase [Kitasatospora sp. MAA4]|uniref:AAA family ATPase n=1 Tax=Kitasatospora sp. MAA4 TaxID=3035093 RepID=UPI002475E70D|nr:AAA family ATPase [Kitasatospora sp. MAA4]MDH6134277.1 nicotinamide riboside kinase [Kitasatospora sp. MAA4]
MVTPLHIRIAGTHSTGKTTLARRIEMELRATGLTVTRTGGLAKRAAALGFPKMTRHTIASTEWIIAAGAAAVREAELTAEVVIIDRTAHDAIAYLQAANQHRHETILTNDLARLMALADLHSHRPAGYLATVLDPAMPLAAPIGKDPDWTETGFRTAVDEYLHQLLAERNIDHLAVPSDSHATAVRAAVEAVHDAMATA